MAPAVAFKGIKKAPKIHRSTMETLILTVDQVNKWVTPPWQRPIRVNSKVMAIAEEMKHSQTIVGMITLGKLGTGPEEYIVDGQHRSEAFRISGLSEIIADVRIVHFDDMAEMSEEFVRLNTALVRMRPDDLLRGLVPTKPNLQLLLKECPFIGFDNIRRRDHAGPIVSLSAVVRCWFASGQDAPSAAAGRDGSVAHLAGALDRDNAEKLARFLNLAHTAWGHDPEYFRMWGNLNLALCMWLYRRIVLDKERKGSAQRVVVLSPEEFKECLMQVSADGNYLAWLHGRLLRDSDRSPAFTRIKAAFQRRLSETRTNKVYLPMPSWATR